MSVDATPLIAVQGLAKVWPDGAEVLRDVTLDLPSTPQFLSLVGPSGCGKTTLLRLIAGLERPSRGAVAWSGAASKGANKGGAPQIGYVFQEPTLMPWATVFENVYLPFKIAGVSRRAAQDAIMEALRGVHLEDAAARYPRELSGGMKMRVSIARALAPRPKVLLMDEPFAALDEITRLKLNNDLLALWQALSMTVIFVTHSVFESVYLSNRIVVMAARPGRIAADLAIEAPYPRDEAFRGSALYTEACFEVSAALRRAMGQAP
jgi:NitT/TauT family transport system ATP-binding protein